MNELIKELSVKKCICREKNAVERAKEVNQLLGLNFRPNSIAQKVEDFEKKLKLDSDQLQKVVPSNCTDRINFISKFYQWTPVKPEMLQKFTKNCDVSAALRSKANEQFVKKKNMEMARQLYNVAVMFAEPTGEELGIAFANRSAVLLEMKDPSGALKDVDLAIQHNYPEGLMPKLKKRREKSLQMLEDFKRSDWFQDSQHEFPEIQKIRDELKLKKPNPLIPSAESFVKIGHTDDLGRQLIVTKDIPVGTVVIVERPFLWVNAGLFEFEARHCDNCYKFTKNGIPCKQCVFVMYCSEECRTNATNGHHKFECTCLSSFYFDCIDSASLLAFRIVCKVGPEEFYRLFTTNDPNYFDRKKPFGTERGCKYESDSYLPIHHLTSNSTTLDKKKRLENGLKCLQMVSVLEARTNFFQVSERRKEFKNFVAATLLHLMEALPCNWLVTEKAEALLGRSFAHLYQIHETKGTIEQVLEADTFFERTSFGIYSVASLMNHACDFNTLRVYDSHGTMVVVTSRGVKKGEPLTTSYGAMYDSTMSVMERREYLMKGYGFKCECFACKNDWAIAGDLFMSALEHKNEFTCPTCSKKFTQEGKCSPKFLKCCLTGSRPTCRLCSKSFTRKKLEDDFQLVMQTFIETGDYIEDNLIAEVVEIYKNILSPYLQYNVRPPHYVLGQSRQLFHQTLALIVYSED